MASSSADDFADNSKKQSSFNLFEGWKQDEEKSFFDKLFRRDKANANANANAAEADQEEQEKEQDDDGVAIEQIAQEGAKNDDDDDDDDEGDDDKKQGWSFWANAVQSLLKPDAATAATTTNDSDDGEGISVQALVEKARAFQQEVAAEADNNNNNNSSKDNIETLQNEIKLVWEQMSTSFGDDKNITDNMKLLNPVSFQYFLEQDESIKTPSWKRRKHRFQQELAKQHNKLQEQVFALHDALYLAETSYLDSIDDIRAALQNYKGGSSYELVYCNTEAEPRQPAHYIALKKGPLAKKSSSSSSSSTTNKQQQHGGGPFVFPWQKQTDRVLSVLMVVRGTKDFSDMLSDSLLQSREFGGDGYYAHDGVCASGEFLVQKHLEFLQHLLTESKCTKIQLSLIGHSLGAGAAAVACIEFNTKFPDNKMDATCIGFGCPALLSKELSEKWMDRITTVICDADCVPRMSKATVSNLILDVMSNDWTEQALEDVNELVDVVQKNIPLPADKLKEAIGWVTDYLHENVKPDIDKVTKERYEVELFPPGRCIHFFRDGQGISVRYMPCTFFDQFDVCRTMVDDHLVSTGYNRVFLELIRQTANDSRFFFRNDVNGLRVEKDRRQNPETSDNNE